MSAAKHTPGPWTVGGPYGYKTVLLNARGESIANGGNNRKVQGEELEASLMLAAAAPDMLAVLQTMPWPEHKSGICHLTGDWFEWLHKAKDAIAKATGGQP